jgi:hypothetical protein
MRVEGVLFLIWAGLASGKDVVGKREWWKLWKWKTLMVDSVTSLATVSKTCEGKPPAKQQRHKESGSMSGVTHASTHAHTSSTRNIVAIGYIYTYLHVQYTEVVAYTHLIIILTLPWFPRTKHQE